MEKQKNIGLKSALRLSKIDSLISIDSYRLTAHIDLFDSIMSLV